jgi:hypothetical protein
MADGGRGTHVPGRRWRSTDLSDLFSALFDDDAEFIVVAAHAGILH